MKNRSIGTHNMNEYSSRSHSILTVNITSEQAVSDIIKIRIEYEVSQIEILNLLKVQIMIRRSINYYLSNYYILSWEEFLIDQINLHQKLNLFADGKRCVHLETRQD